MPSPIIDERTLAGWLGAPTELRAARLESANEDPVIQYADIEEHVKDPESGRTVRCDLTLRSKTRPLMNIELKRPEVADAASPVIQLDAWKKAISRGANYFGTSNFNEICVWDTSAGPNQISPLIRFTLTPNLTQSSQARLRRDEMGANWSHFLDQVAPIINPVHRSKQVPLPPQVVDLREAIEHVAEDAALRIREAAAKSDEFRDKALESFRAQFGVEISLDPLGNAETFNEESMQIALISAFVVSTRILLYQALITSQDAGLHSYDLDELDISRTTKDAGRVASDLSSLYAHARKRTGNFEFQLQETELDDIVFVDSPGIGDVGHRWGKLVDVVKKADWTGPAAYVPGLYESLLDENHRHVMGVHYTPEPVAEVVTSYVVRSATDTIMDPACGAGTFVTMSYDRKRHLGSTHEQALSEVFAVELADFAASLTSLSLSLADTSGGASYPSVFRTDFFHTEPGGASALHHPGAGQVDYPTKLDGIIGNPPYIRFENRTPHERSEIYDFLGKMFARSQLPLPNLTGKADIWAFFVAASMSYLKPGGRLGFVLSWSLLSSDYGDAVLSLLGRYFLVDMIIDSRTERWFAAKQNTLILLARRAEDPPSKSRDRGNPSIPDDHPVKFVRFKQPIDTLIDAQASRGQRAEDVIDELEQITADVGDDLRWDVRIFPQGQLTRRTEGTSDD